MIDGGGKEVYKDAAQIAAEAMERLDRARASGQSPVEVARFQRAAVRAGVAARDAEIEANKPMNRLLGLLKKVVGK